MGSRERPSSDGGDEGRLRLALAVGLEPILRGRLPGQRWFRSKGRVVRGVRVADAVPLGPDLDAPWLVLAEVEFAEGSPATYALLVRLGGAGADGPLGAVETGEAVVPVHDALDDPAACQVLLHRFARGGSVPLASDRLRFTRTGAFVESALALPPASVRRLGGEQSNTCVVFGDALVLKVFRQVEPGINPDAEMTGVLTARTGFRHIPLLAGTLDYVGPDGTAWTVAILQRFVPNQGDGWTVALVHLGRLLDQVAGRHPPPPGETAAMREVAEVAASLGDGFVASLRRLGEVTAELHLALASVDEPAFAPQPIGPADVRAWRIALTTLARRALAALHGRLSTLPDDVRLLAASVLARSGDVERAGDALSELVTLGAAKIRIHGDYHLGQTLRTPDGYVLFDFEGEPARPLGDRRTKHCPLRDVAGMLRSFDYAASMVAAARENGPSPPEAVVAWARAWERLAAETFLTGYRSAIDRQGVVLLPGSPALIAKMLGVYELEKALYELDYELDNRPAWVRIPLAGLDRLLGAVAGPEGVRGTRP
jgi:maltose alpha-D-glucosyltransferase/alpha-amylase